MLESFNRDNKISINEKMLRISENKLNVLDKLIMTENMTKLIGKIELNENIVIDKSVILVSSGFVELFSYNDNVITCIAQNEGCLIKGFSIRRLDKTKGDPLSTGA